MKRQPSLRPGDVAVALWLSIGNDERYETVSDVLEIGLGEAHRSVGRLRDAGLLLPESRQPARDELLAFIVSGVRYCFYPVLGPETRGVPTAHSAPPLDQIIVSDSPVVWPDASGYARGSSLLPLFPGAPAAARRDASLYQALALVDAIRMGRARERKAAEKALREMVGGRS